MGVPRTLAATTVGSSSSPVPAYSGTIIAAQSFFILNDIATIILGSGNLPKNGYNGPNGYPNRSPRSPMVILTFTAASRVEQQAMRDPLAGSKSPCGDSRPRRSFNG